MTSTVPCPTGISFPSIRCRLDALANRLDRDVPAGGLHHTLVDKLRSVRPLLDQAESLDRKRALALLKKVVRGPHFIESHLRAPKAVALVPNGVRQALVASAGALASDLRALLRALKVSL